MSPAKKKKNNWIDISIVGTNLERLFPVFLFIISFVSVLVFDEWFYDKILIGNERFLGDGSAIGVYSFDAEKFHEISKTRKYAV